MHLRKTWILGVHGVEFYRLKCVPQNSIAAQPSVPQKVTSLKKRPLKK